MLEKVIMWVENVISFLHIFETNKPTKRFIKILYEMIKITKTVYDLNNVFQYKSEVGILVSIQIKNLLTT